MRECIDILYGGTVIVTINKEDYKEFANKFMKSRPYFKRLWKEDEFTTRTRSAKKDDISPQQLVCLYTKYDSEEIYLTYQEAQYLNAFYIGYVDDMVNTIPKLEKLINITGVTEVRSTIETIWELAENPLKYVGKFIMDDEIMHCRSIFEYFKILTDYENAYELVWRSLPKLSCFI